MKAVGFILLAALLTMVSCTDPFPGYSRIDEGLYFKIRSFTDDTLRPQPGDMIRFEIKMDELLYSSTDRSFLIPYDPTAKGFQAEFHRFYIGDSIGLIFSSERMREEFDLRLPVGEDYHAIEMVMRDVIPRRKWEVDRAVALRLAKDKEALAIAEFLQTSDREFSRQGECWVASEYAGFGQAVESDTPLYVYYVSRLLDGRPIEMNIGADDYLSYRLGMQGQMIAGLEAAISQAEYDVPIDLIIPFSEAFGERGVPGIVPPFSPMHYTVIVRREKKPFDISF